MPAFSRYFCNPWPSQALNLTGDLASPSAKTVRGGVANLTVSGNTTANSVSVSALSNAGTTINTTITPSGGSFSGSLKLPVGIHTITVTAGNVTRTRQVYVPYHFMGINGHPDLNRTAANGYVWDEPGWLSYCNSVGAKTIRMNSYNSDATMNARVRSLMDYMWNNNTGISVLPCISVNPILKHYKSGAVVNDGSGFDHIGNEDENYTLGFNTGQLVAQRLQAPVYECGNELFTRGATAAGNDENPVQIISGVQGDNVNQYATPGWKCVRGLQRGLIDGVKSVQPNAKCGANFVAAQIAASDMLWYGNNPDGTSEPSKACKFDIVTLHNYQAQGSLFNITTNGHGSNFDVFAYMRNAYQDAQGNPLDVHITEWNGKPEDADTTAAVSWMNQELPKHFAHRSGGTIATSGLISSSYYQAAHDGVDFGLDDRPNKTAAFLAFANNNPDT